MDQFTRQIAAHALSARNDAELALGAIEALLENRNLKPGWIHHSDRGAGYASELTQNAIETAKGLPSF